MYYLKGTSVFTPLSLCVLVIFLFEAASPLSGIIVLYNDISLSLLAFDWSKLNSVMNVNGFKNVCIYLTKKGKHRHIIYIKLVRTCDILHVSPYILKSVIMNCFLYLSELSCSSVIMCVWKGWLNSPYTYCRVCIDTLYPHCCFRHNLHWPILVLCRNHKDI